MKKSATVIYLVCTYSSGCTYLRSNMNITEREVELQKEKCQKLTIAKGDN